MRKGAETMIPSEQQREGGTYLQGEPVGVAPRNVLKRVLKLYDAEGWEPVVAPEMEFYLIKPNLNPNEPIEPPVGRTGRQMVSRQAYSMSAVDEYGKVIDDIYDFSEAQGFEIDTIIQEGGAGQVEINFLHGGQQVPLDPITQQLQRVVVDAHVGIAQPLL